MQEATSWRVAVLALGFFGCDSDSESSDAAAAAGGSAGDMAVAGDGASGGTSADLGARTDAPSGTVDGSVPVADQGGLADVPLLPDVPVVTCPPALAATAVDLNAHAAGAGFLYNGDTTAAMDTTHGNCGGEGSPDVLHRFVAPHAGSWRFDTEETEPKWDTVISLRGLCDDVGVGSCNDDGAFPPASRVSAALEAGETIWVVVDGHSGGASPDRGAYALSVTAQ